MHKSRPSFRNSYLSRSSFSASSIPRMSRRQHSSLSINTTKTSVQHTSECILFPTYALRDPKDPQSWVIRTKGWALTMKKAGPKQKVLKGITKSIAGKSSANQISNRMFENRFKYFLAKGKRNKHFFIEAIGSVENSEWSQDNNDLNITKHEEATVQNDKSFEKPTTSLWSQDNPNLDILSIHPVSADLNKKISPSQLSDDSEDEDEFEEDDEDEEGDEKDGSDDYKPPTPIPSPIDNNTDSLGVTLRSERTGVFSGHFKIPDTKIQKWKSQSTSGKRIIRIKSELFKSNTNDMLIPPSHGFVHLIEPEGVSVISDIDDTIKNTTVLAGARAVLKNTFFNPTRSIPGMAETYSHWYNLGASFHYVSNSPFQLIHVLFSFLHNHHFPPGSLHLRPNTGFISKLRASKRSKKDSICSIIRDFPHRKFILVGDSGEIDLEIYTKIATEFPGQVVKIFIRDVTTAAGNYQKAKERAPQSKSNSFQSFFTSNIPPKSHIDTLSIKEDSASYPSEDELQDDDVSDEGMDEAASKLMELVLEPSLTGHGPVNNTEPDDLPEFVDPAIVRQPLSERLMQLHSRLSLARNHLKDIDIVLFKDAGELLSDEEVQQVLQT